MRDRSAALISGDGPIGLLMLILLKRAGVEHIALIGGQPRRLALAKEIGATQVINRTELGGGDPIKAIRNATGRLFPNVIEASGSGDGMTAALHLVSRGGKVLEVGDYGPATASFKWNLLLHNEIRSESEPTPAPAPGREAVRLVTADALPVQRIVTHEFKMAQFSEAFGLARARTQAIKILLHWD